MPKLTIIDGVVTTDPDDKDSTINASFKFSCACGYAGTISMKMAKIHKLVTDKVTFNDPKGSVKCPNCGDDLTVPGGTFILDESTGEMVRQEV